MMINTKERTEVKKYLKVQSNKGSEGKKLFQEGYEHQYVLLS